MVAEFCLVVAKFGNEGEFGVGQQVLVFGLVLGILIASGVVGCALDFRAVEAVELYALVHIDCSILGKMAYAITPIVVFFFATEPVFPFLFFPRVGGVIDVEVFAVK